MKASEMVKLLRKHGFKLKRHGAEHDIYWNPTTKAEVQIPRQPAKEIKKGTANRILKDAGLK